MKYPKIPQNLKGNSHDVVSMKCVDTLESADSYFKTVVERLISVKDWCSYSDKVKTKFVIINSDTAQETNEFDTGNMIRIEIPGPGTASGKGYDWTKIIDITTNKDDAELPFFAMTLKPCSPPNANNEVIAHFYKEKSSNTFVIRRIGDCIYAEVHGRNETINISDVPLLDSIRNIGINMGTKIGLGGLNWLALTEGLLVEPPK